MTTVSVHSNAPIESDDNVGIPGNWRADMPIPASTSLGELEENLDGKRKELFIDFMRSMLQWVPEDRISTKELLKDPWLNDMIE